MPSSRQFLEEGIDPTALACVSVADLLQMFRASFPASDIGYVISAEETALPDVGLFPEVARFLVRGLDAGVPTGKVYFYNGASWQLIYANLFIADASLPITKLSPTGGSSLDIIRVNVAGDAFEFTDIIDALIAGTVPINKLVQTNPSPGVLATNGAAISWLDYANLWAALFADAVPLGDNRDILYINGSFLAFGDLNTILPNNSLEWRKIKYGTNIVPIVGGVVVIDASLSGNFKIDLTGNITDLTIVNLLEGMTIQILFKQDGAGAKTVDFTNALINWIGGSAPTITVTASHGDIISVSDYDGQRVGIFAQDTNLT